MTETLEIAWDTETLELIMDALVGCLVKDVWKDNDPRREHAKRTIRLAHELILDRRDRASLLRDA